MPRFITQFTFNLYYFFFSIYVYGCMFLCFVRAWGYTHILNLRSDRQWSASSAVRHWCLRVRFASYHITNPPNPFKFFTYATKSNSQFFVFIFIKNYDYTEYEALLNLECFPGINTAHQTPQKHAENQSYTKEFVHTRIPENHSTHSRIIHALTKGWLFRRIMSYLQWRYEIKYAEDELCIDVCVVVIFALFNRAAITPLFT